MCAGTVNSPVAGEAMKPHSKLLLAPTGNCGSHSASETFFLQERSLQKVIAGQMQKATDHGMPTTIYTLTTQPPHLMLREHYGKGEGRFYRPEDEEIWGG